MRITETIRHGDIHLVRTGEIEPTYEQFVAFLQLSPYATDVVRPDNRFVRKAFDALMVDGKSGFGWAEYEVTA